MAEALRDLGIRNGKIGIKERIRFFFDGIRKEAPHMDYVSTDTVTIECRVIKSPAEIALMQKAADITIVAYKVTVAKFEKGMTNDDIRAIASQAHRALGVSGSIGAQIAKASANPHGSIKHIEVKEGDIVLMDGGCSVDGYRSDISRTILFGEPTPKQIELVFLRFFYFLGAKPLSYIGSLHRHPEALILSGLECFFPPNPSSIPCPNLILTSLNPLVQFWHV